MSTFLKQKPLGLLVRCYLKTFDDLRVVTHETNFQRVGALGYIFQSEIAVKIGKHFSIQFHNFYSGPGQRFGVLCI